VLPEKMWTTTGVPSLVVVPEKEGVVSFDNAGGPLIDSFGASVSTVNVTVLLVPTFPAPSFCVAVAVYSPLASGPLVPDQLPPLGVAWNSSTCVFPEKMWTTTGVPSLVVVPEKEGVVSFDIAAGPLIVSFGDSVSTVKDTVLLVPTFPASSFCVALAVYAPLASGPPVPDQLPPLGVASNSSTCVLPEKMWTTTGVPSLVVVPEKEGVVSFDNAAGPLIDSFGDSVSTVNVTGLLVPTFPASSSCVA
jgi:hypothetical protein